MAPLWAAVLGALLAVGSSATTPAPAPAAAAPAALLALSVNPKKMSALVGERFIGLTMDPIDLSQHRKLGPGAVRTRAMAKGLAPAVLRLAGPSSDSLHFAAAASAPGAASRNGTVTEADLVAVAEWARAADWDLVVALNALARTADNHWDDAEARQLLAVADHHGVPLALQLGYEAGALDRSGVSGSRLGADLSTAHALLAEFPRYQDAPLLGPDVAVAPAASRAAKDAAHYLQDEARAAAASPDAVVWQPWSEAEGRDPVSDPDLVREDVNRLLGRAAARRPLWIAESGAAPSRTFSGALQWAQRVQLAARVGADVILRQWQTPGEDHQPTPDYWVSLLHRRLCGRAVLDSKLAGDKAGASVTAQCTAAAPPTDALNPRLHGSFTKLSYERGDVTLMAVNPTATDAKLAIKFSPAAGVRQAIVHEYVLTAPGHDMGSRSTLLNGHLLAMDNGGVLPGLVPRVRRADRDAVLDVPAHSVAFFVLPGAQARACVTAPPSAVESDAAGVPLQLGPGTQDVHVQFHMEDLPTAPAKSKAKDKLAATQAKAAAKDDAHKNSHRSEAHSANGRPLAWASVTDLEKVADPVDATPRTKRASPSPHPRSAPPTPEEWMERLEKAHAARKQHLLPHAAHAAHAAEAQDELPDSHASTIPAAHIYRPNDKEDAPAKPGHRLPPLKPFKLPKRTPLVPAVPHAAVVHHVHAKRPAAPVPRLKPLPKTGAVVASLVDPVRGVSAEDASVEEEGGEEDHFPTGEVLAEVGVSGEEAASSETSNDGGLDYIQDDEEDDEGRGQADAAAPPAPQGQQDGQAPQPSNQYYFAPGEFTYSPPAGAAPAGPKKAVAYDGEIGEMDMMVPAVEVAEQSTPSPYEPHLEEFVIMQAPQKTAEEEKQDRLRAEEDMTRLYQSVADAAQDLQRERPPSDDEQEINTDVLIELGKKYLREKKMALKEGSHDLAAEETVDAAASAPSAPSGPAEDDVEDDQQHVRRKRQAAFRLALPTGAEGKPRPRASTPPRPRPSARANSAEDTRRQLPRDLRLELEQRVNERRERLEKARETVSAPSPSPRAREQPDRERLARAREQLEQQRQQREQQREEQREQQQRQQREQQRELSDRGGLARAREQLGQQRQQREQAERERIAKAREQLQERERERSRPPALRRAERVKRSDAPCEYLDSFGKHDALSHIGHAWHKVAPTALPRHHHARLDGTPSARFKYGHTPQRQHKNVHKNVHHEVVKKTNVVRYLPAEEEDTEEQEKDVRRLDVSSEEVARPAVNQLRRRQHQAYRPHDNLGALWAGSPLSPLRQRGQQTWVSAPARPVAQPAAQVEATSYEAAAPEDAPAEDESATEYMPDEVKTTEIVKTERTYEAPATESWAAQGADEDSGYGSETEPEDVVESSSASYASLEETTSHHHHDHHHHHHVHGEAVYQAETQPEDQEQEQEPEQVEAQYATDAQQPVVPPEAEGEAGPVPEFPFKQPAGPKHHVVGFTADDYSPGGWYTFASGAETASTKQQPSTASYAQPPARQQPAPVARKRPATSPPAPSKKRPTQQLQAAATSTWTVSRPRANEHAAVDVVPPAGSWTAARQPPSVEVSPWKEAAPAGVPSWSGHSSQPQAAPQAAPQPQYQPQISVAVKEEPEYAPPPQQAARYPAPSRQQAAPAVAPQPQYQPEISVAVEEEPEYAEPPQQAARYPTPSRQLAVPVAAPQPQLSVDVEEEPEYAAPPQQAARYSVPSRQQAAPVVAPQPQFQPPSQPQFQPPSQPQYQQPLSVAVEETPEYRPAPSRRQQARQQQQPQQVAVPESLSFLAKFFQPVEPVQQSRPVKKQPLPARSQWDQPAPVDNAWAQPAQPAPASSSWTQPAPAAAADAWSQSPPAASLWNQPAANTNAWGSAPAGNAWGQPQPAPADDPWGQPAAVRPQAPVVRNNFKEASLASPGDQLLDYSKDILRYKPDVRSAAAPSMQFASLAMAGMEEPAAPPPARPASAARRPARPAASPPAEWELPTHRVRRSAAEAPAAPELDDALLRRRVVRGLFDGGRQEKHPDDLDDEDWSAETERMRKKKKAHQQRQRDQQDQGDRSNIQFLGENGYVSEVMSSLLGKVVGVIGYLGNRLTRLTGGHQ